MESFYYVPLLTLLSCFISQGECIKCYLCSFSPDDRNNRTDKCTDSNFQHQTAHLECNLGCETVIQYDPNDEMEQWRRNCLQEGHKMTGDCETEKTVGYRLVRCSCDKDLCNISQRTTAGYVSLMFSVLTFLWSYHSKLK